MYMQVRIVEDQLQITDEFYSSYRGRYLETKILPLVDIERIEANVGPKGGMHTWAVKGYDVNYSNKEYYKGRERDIEIFTGDRKNSHLIDEIRQLLPTIEYREKVEDGGAPW